MRLRWGNVTAVLGKSLADPPRCDLEGFVEILVDGVKLGMYLFHFGLVHSGE